MIIREMKKLMRMYIACYENQPMDFATGVTKAGNDLRGLIEFVISQAKQSGKTILFDRSGSL